MQSNPKYSEKLVHVMAPVSPSGLVTSAAIDCQGFEKGMLVVNVGVMASSATIDVSITECATATGSFVAASGLAFTQILAATGASQSYLADINLKARLRYIKVLVTQGAAAVLVSANLILSGAKYRPITQDDTVEFMA